MGKFINEISGANRLHRGMEKILEEGHELPEGVTLEGAKGILDTWGWTEESMKMAFENGIVATLCTIGGIAVGYACVKVIGLVKEYIKMKKEEEESEEEA